MFECRDLRVMYNGTPAVDGCSFSVEKGEQLAIIGPSGAGKTTLLHLMGGLLEPDAGTLLIDGQDSSSLQTGRELARRVGVMHQQFDLVDLLPALHNVLAGRLGEWGILRSLWSLLVPQEKQRAETALKRVGIPEKLDTKTAHLSGGEQQRVALARLLVQRPRAILADEPVASVDPARARDLLQTLVDVASQQPCTLVVSLHSVELALEYFPRVVALRKGKIRFDRASETIDPEDLERLYELPRSTAP